MFMCLTKYHAMKRHSLLLGHHEVRSKISLCLTKDHAMKMYPVLNEASRREDALGSGGIALRLLT
jgi:hypothetical protein